MQTLQAPPNPPAPWHRVVIELESLKRDDASDPPKMTGVMDSQELARLQADLANAKTSPDAPTHIWYAFAESDDNGIATQSLLPLKGTSITSVTDLPNYKLENQLSYSIGRDAAQMGRQEYTRRMN